MEKKIVAFVPIKLNNQRLPGKNLMLLQGQPLCSYLFRTLLEVAEIEERYVYCSDEKIVSYIPEGIRFLKRSEELDGFRVKGLEIIGRFIQDVDADIYVLAHVTQPFTSAASITSALKAVISGEYDSAFSAVRFQDYFWKGTVPLNFDPKDIPRTQDLEPIYMETGAFFVFRKEVYCEMGQRIGKHPYVCELGQIESIDIDTAEDFSFAEIAAAYLQGKELR